MINPGDGLSAADALSGRVDSASDSMDLSKAGWLEDLLKGVVAAHRGAPALEPSSLSARGRARAHLRRHLRESGLIYGTPASRGEEPQDLGAAPEEQLFVAILEQLSSLALDIAALLESKLKATPDSLLVIFASLTGLFNEAEQIDQSLNSSRSVPQRTWARLENALAQRALSLGGDPVFGLVLHNGAVYVDAQVFGRQAIDYFSRGVFLARQARRRFEFAARLKVVLVEVLTALVSVERRPSFSTRRAILRQIEDLQLPVDCETELRDYVKSAFDRRPSLEALLKGVRSRDLRRFILEQTLLVSLVHARQSPTELAFVQELSLALGFSADALRQIEMEVAEFYARRRSVIDVFTVSKGAGVMGQEMVDRMQRAVEKNFHRLMKEIRETGELSVLLTKAARGHKLTKEERAKVREQLIDVAKAIPALAIFAAPGGVLLFIALAKVLPFNLLPSSFQDDDDAHSVSKASRN